MYLESSSEMPGVLGIQVGSVGLCCYYRQLAMTFLEDTGPGCLTLPSEGSEGQQTQEPLVMRFHGLEH